MLKCTRCGTLHRVDMATVCCQQCGDPLEVEYSGPLTTGIPHPFHNIESAVTLGEGDTPVVRLPRFEKKLGLRCLLAKLEFMNPTGSYKDRGTAAMMSMVREFGIDEVVEDSSGNAGASLAAYAARSAIKAHVFVPSSAPPAKIKQIRVYGAETHPIDGSREEVTKAALDFCQTHNLVYVSHNMSPFFVEGTKSFAYEMVTQMEDSLPDHIVMPVGNGGLYLGVWKGFEEIQKLSTINIPRLHLIQTKAICPIVSAFNNETWDSSSGNTTIAGGISVANPPRLRQIIDVLRGSDGVAFAIDDSEILPAQMELASEEGIYCEPTSAVAIVGLKHLMVQGVIDPNEKVLVVLTGFGLKDRAPV